MTWAVAGAARVLQGGIQGAQVRGAFAPEVELPTDASSETDAAGEHATETDAAGEHATETDAAGEHATSVSMQPL